MRFEILITERAVTALKRLGDKNMLDHLVFIDSLFNYSDGAKQYTFVS